MSLFCIADLHLSIGVDKPMDIFEGWDNHIERLLNNWNSIVKDEDTVIVAGDICWALKLDECYKDFEFINNKLKGNKIFLKGNHDLWWGTKKKVDNYLEENNFNLTVSIDSDDHYLEETVQKLVQTYHLRFLPCSDNIRTENIDILFTDANTYTSIYKNIDSASQKEVATQMIHISI